jgi:hypothetical protein
VARLGVWWSVSLDVSPDARLSVCSGVYFGVRLGLSLSLEFLRSRLLKVDLLGSLAAFKSPEKLGTAP